MLTGDDNVPNVKVVNDLSFWLSPVGFEKIAKDIDAVPGDVRHLLDDTYICFYSAICDP